MINIPVSVLAVIGSDKHSNCADIKLMSFLTPGITLTWPVARLTYTSETSRILDNIKGRMDHLESFLQQVNVPGSKHVRSTETISD